VHPSAPTARKCLHFAEVFSQLREPLSFVCTQLSVYKGNNKIHYITCLHELWTCSIWVISICSQEAAIGTEFTVSLQIVQHDWFTSLHRCMEVSIATGHVISTDWLTINNSSDSSLSLACLYTTNFIPLSFKWACRLHDTYNSESNLLKMYNVYQYVITHFLVFTS